MQAINPEKRVSPLFIYLEDDGCEGKEKSSQFSSWVLCFLFCPKFITGFYCNSSKRNMTMLMGSSGMLSKVKKSSNEKSNYLRKVCTDTNEQHMNGNE